MNQTATARLGLMAAVPLTTLVIGFAPLALFADELPDRVATHYDGSGMPDGSMTVAQFALTTGAMMAVGIAMLVAVALTSRRLAQPAPAAGGFLGGFLAGLGAGIFGAEIVAQRGNDSWLDATSPAWVLSWALLLAIAVGAIGARLATLLPHDDSRHHGQETTPVLALAESEHAVWSGSIASDFMLVLGVGFGAAGVPVFALASRPIGAVLLITGLLVSTLSRVRVLADDTGLTLRYGLLGLPRQRIPLNEVERASVIDVRPSQWGGWGYRGSLRMMKQAALVLRGGPGLRLDLTGGRTFVVAVDHPEGAAAVLNGERSRRPMGAC